MSRGTLTVPSARISVKIRLDFPNTGSAHKVPFWYTSLTST